jgi:hypothetical protein
MSSVPAMEEVQERTGEKQQVGKRAQGVSGVFGHDEKGGDRQKGDQQPSRARSEPGT